jgi:D-serine dehydratase
MLTLPRIADIDAWRIDGTIKGYPGQCAPRPLGEIRDCGWNVLAGDLPLPVAVLKASALAHNRLWMRRFLASTGALLAPHGKTTMSPQLFAAQLEDGAFGITCATVAQLQVYRRYGIQRVFMANQVIGAQGIDYVVGELARDPGFEIYLIVDSVAGIDQLAVAAARAALGRPVRVLIEVGTPGGRTGVRSIEDVGVLIDAIDAAGSTLALHGIESYEDVVRGDAAEVEVAIGALLALQLRASALARRSTAAQGRTPWLLSAGGSVYFDLVAGALAQPTGSPSSVLLRSGCYESAWTR